MVRYSTIVPHQKRMRHDETPKPKKSEIARLRIQNRVPAYVPNHFVIPKSRFPFLILKFLRNLPVWVLQMLEPQKKTPCARLSRWKERFFRGVHESADANFGSGGGFWLPFLVPRIMVLIFFGWWFQIFFIFTPT